MAQARILHVLGIRRTLSLSDKSLRQSLGEVLEAAVEGLLASGLAALDGGGILRAGPRGSVLSAQGVLGQLGAPFAYDIEVEPVVSSTNDVVFRRAARGARPGAVTLAELQTKGRGRFGRGFVSPPGLGIWSTILLEVPRDLEASPRLSILCALAVARALAALAGVAPGLKWPNDVRIDGKKVCGILVEGRGTGSEFFLVAGIGLNVHHRAEEFPPELRESAGSLEMLAGRRLERERVFAGVLRELAHVLAKDLEGAHVLSEEFRRYDELEGEEVALERGGEVVTGVAHGIEEDGSLVVTVAGEGRRLFRAGETSLKAKGR
jgi:BirA family biotin operon repressor/biotin-[acetyl-CoA-carboxylase] ligase